MLEKQLAEAQKLNSNSTSLLEGVSPHQQQVHFLQSAALRLNTTAYSDSATLTD